MFCRKIDRIPVPPLADQAVELARKDLERERETATDAANDAAANARTAAEASIEVVDSEVDREARVGDLGDAINRLRGGG